MRCATSRLTIADGEYVSLMGPSGSGKSTLLNILGLLDRPTSGTYRLDGQDVTALSDEQQARVRREKIGFVFQFFHLVPRLTAQQNIELPMMLAGHRPPNSGTRARASCCNATGWPTARITGPSNSPAASASAWLSRAPP